MTLNDYLYSLEGKTVAVLGYGISNAPLVELLLDFGIETTICDKRSEENFPDSDKLLARGCNLRLGENYLKNLKEDIIFRTPGLHPFTPELVEAVENGAYLTSEMELFFSLCPCHIIAVTGSDGKTTTSTLIARLLEASGHKVFLGGNIGTPLLKSLPEMEKEHFVVLELSSFQLHSMRCKPNTAVITNITPNHLDVHPDLDDYIDAKKNIFLSQDENDRLVLNYSDPKSEEFSKIAMSKISYFSMGHAVKNGVFCVDDLIYSAKDYAVNEIIASECILIPGLHNVENYMAAYAACAEFITDSAFRQTARSFGGVPHRIELIRQKDGVRYYNDSIASSPTRTIAGLRSFNKPKPILIAGGYDKHIPFDELGEEIVNRVKALYLTGDTAQSIKNAVINAPGYNRNTLPIHIIDDFKETVQRAADTAETGDVVLLSPACASFDKFKNFSERGETFRKIVTEL